MIKNIISTLVVLLIIAIFVNRQQPTMLALAGTKQVVAWGSNFRGESMIPTGVSTVIDIAGGDFHGVALRSNGTVVAWGDNTYGQQNIPIGLNSVTQITAGPNHTIALKANRTIVGWGDNSHKQLNFPVGLTDVAAVASKGEHTVVLKTNGTVQAWGWNNHGQTRVPAGLTNVKAIAAGGYHTMALRADGTVIAWGNNAYGESTPPAGLRNVVAIAGGGSHSLALKSDGTVVAWGYNLSGQSTVPRGLSGVVAIAAGWEHSAALKADGTIISWGMNSGLGGQLSNELTKVITLESGSYFLLALTDTGFIPSRSMTRSRTKTQVLTPTRTRTASMTRTPTPLPVSFVQSDIDGSSYSGRGVVLGIGGGEVFVKAQNRTNKTISNVTIRIQYETPFTSSTANCFSASVSTIKPFETSIIRLPFRGEVLNYRNSKRVYIQCDYPIGGPYELTGEINYFIDEKPFSAPITVSFLAKEPTYQSPTRTPTPHPPILRNPYFETGRQYWTTTTRSKSTIIQKLPPITHTGEWLAVFGNTNNESATMSQTFYVLPTYDTLSFWYKIQSTERCGFT
jgi:hypothetical protein